MAPRSKLFCPYKVVGLVSLGMPFIFGYHSKKKSYFLQVPLGNAFHIYRAFDLSLTDVSKSLSSNISCLVSDGTTVCSATQDGNIQVWGTGTTTLIRQWHCHDASIQLLCVFGGTTVSVDEENILKVSHINGSLYLDWNFSSETFQIVALMHPPTYLNKVLIGSKQGQMKLLNIKTRKEIHEFSGWESPITVIEPAPAIDVVAIGLEDGRIIIHNIKFDETIMTLQQESGKVTSLSFRTDNNARLMSGSSLGSVYIWDLEEKCLKSSIVKAHSGPILSLACASKEPLVYTSSTDNVIRSWVCDMPDGGARQFQFREGHSAPPMRVRYHGPNGETMVSAGQDSTMRRASPTSGKSTCVAEAISNKAEKKSKKYVATVKMPSITAFTTEFAKEKAWDSAAAIHQNTCEVTTYSISLSKINHKRLIHSRFENNSYSNAMAMCIDISMCGNFLFVGFNTGHIDKYNIQSGLFILAYVDDDVHSSAVRGIVTDSLNHWVVSGDQDGILQWWCLHKGNKDKTVELDSGVCSMVLHRDSGLFAIALDNWVIFLADIDTKSVVRKLHGHRNQITDLAFTSDSKWLISSSMDCSICTWDLPTAQLVDQFTVSSPATSVALSPVDDYMATTHIDQLGVYLWSNRSCLTFVSLEPLKEDYVPPLLPLPGATQDGSQIVDSDSDESDLEEDVEIDEYKSPKQLSDEFVTIDLMPASRWLHLLNIDQIKKRNKPDEAPKAPKSAPFFLESIAGLNQETTEEEESSKSKLRDRSEFVLETLSPFGSLLKRGELDESFQKLLLMGPSNIDLEIRNLDPDVGGSRDAMLNFLYMIKNIVENRTHFEVAQGYLALFMKRHSEFMTTPDADIEDVCKDLAEQHNKSWHTFREDVNKSLCLLSYFKNSAILNY